MSGFKPNGEIRRLRESTAVLVGAGLLTQGSVPDCRSRQTRQHKWQICQNSLLDGER